MRDGYSTTSPLLPPIETLAGRGQVSFIRYPEDERPKAPLYALSSPGLAASKHDRTGSLVVTAIHHGDECTVTVAGTGQAGTMGGARVVLDEVLGELVTLPPE